MTKLRGIDLFTDEKGKLSSTRLMGLCVAFLFGAVVIGDVWYGKEVTDTVYRTLEGVIFGLVGATTVRSGLKTYTEGRFRQGE